MKVDGSTRGAYRTAGTGRRETGWIELKTEKSLSAPRDHVIWNYIVHLWELEWHEEYSQDNAGVDLGQVSDCPWVATKT